MVTALLEGTPLTRSRAILYVFIAAVLWSTGGLLIKIIDLSPMTIAGMRSGIAALLMIFLLNKNLRFTWSFPQIAGAFAYSATMILFVVAAKITTVANAILLQYTVPIFAALLGAWFLKEKVTRFDWAIIGIVLVGMALFFMDSLTPGGLWGNIMAITSAVTWAFMLIFMRMQKAGSPMETIILGNIISAVICLPFIIQDPPTIANLAPLLYMGLFQIGFSFVLYSIAIKYITALDTVLVQVMDPLLNPLWVFLVIGEVPGMWAVIGGIIVLASVTIRNLYSNRKVPKITQGDGCVPRGTL